MEVVAPALLVPSKYGLENAAFYVFGLVILSRWPHCAVFFFSLAICSGPDGGERLFRDIEFLGRVS